ncbi:zinc-dependent peptidase [Psychroflexus sp. ALD_RP9]|uniref:zinc-dependent peptidase n=1 Tax=Psychroflexus sp. ALD_RP9 TaxID=2777186 RepID=UPI001A8FD34D|nr:zinc-dependent peptidase [Psychroflexus sp. ALD_RP9]QSS97693.1 zinc-dependent peptidase [Psychroflexus sp. ALD_RP9]
MTGYLADVLSISLMIEVSLFDNKALGRSIITAFMLLLVLILLIVVIRSMLALVEDLWVSYIIPKPFYTHLYFVKKRLSEDQLYILENQFVFYQKLQPKKKLYFEHRVANFIRHHQFEGRSGVYINNQHKVLIASTAVMLTFGYRNYRFKSLKTFVIYPDVFQSTSSHAFHKGEFNPAYKTVAFSWKDFLEGYAIENDNFNLGIHELVHVLHFDFQKRKNNAIGATLFVRYYDKIKHKMQSSTEYRQNIKASKLLRNYAFLNSFEFISVLIETFFESPKELKSNFPDLYGNVKKMLNYNDNLD